MKKEVIQILTMDKIEPDNPNDITKEYQRASLGCLMFLKVNVMSESRLRAYVTVVNSGTT